MYKILVLFLLLPLCATAQEEKAKSLFTLGNVKDLTEEQKVIYDRISKRTPSPEAISPLPHMVGTPVVLKVTEIDAEYAGKVDIRFKVNDIKVEILGCQCKPGNKKPSSRTVIFLDEKKTKWIYLGGVNMIGDKLVGGKAVKGLVESGEHTFMIEPLGNWQVMVFQNKKE